MISSNPRPSRWVTNVPGCSPRAEIWPARPESWPASDSARQVSAIFCRSVQLPVVTSVSIFVSAVAMSSCLLACIVSVMGCAFLGARNQ